MLKGGMQAPNKLQDKTSLKNLDSPVSLKQTPENFLTTIITFLGNVIITIIVSDHITGQTGI
jgi:hypothetical protein